MSMTLLDVQNLRKLYGQEAALEGVSFQVCQGEIFGLLGPNGAGKTTLLSIISCLLEATSGAVCLSGQKLSVSNRSLRRDIGIVPQELALYGELTARENLSFFGELYGLGGDGLRRRVEHCSQSGRPGPAWIRISRRRMPLTNLPASSARGRTGPSKIR